MSPAHGVSRQKVLELVRAGVRAGRPPTVREIQQALGFSAVQSAKSHLDALVAEGALEKLEGARGWRLPELPGTLPALHVPVLGRVQAGSLTTAVEEPLGYVAVEARKGRTESELFALKVRGPSMREAGILDGDLVVVQRQASAQNGDIVVALVNDEATVKTLRRRPGRVELHPANPDFQVIVVKPPEALLLLGRVIEVRRTYGGGR
jgi:repressor LexA